MEHPLPEEIQKMARDETVCKFCGVSYLIHNEIKALEDKLRAAEEELVFYRGMEGREATLKAQIEELEGKLAKSTQDLQMKSGELEALQNEFQGYEAELNKMNQAKITSEKKVSELTHTAEQFRLKHSLYSTNLPKIIKQLQDHRNESSTIKSLITAENTVLRDECRKITDAVASVIARKTKELDALQTKLTTLEQTSSSSQEREGQLSAHLETAQAQLEQLSKAEQHSKQLEVETAQLRTNLRDVEGKLEAATTRGRTLELECNQYSDQVKKNAQEMEQVTSQLKQQNKKSEENISRLQREVSDRERRLNSTQAELQELRGRVMEQQRRDEENKQRASASDNRTTELQQAVDKVTSDIAALKSEREMMISAHQTQIEQLRESFKKRISEADKWPRKMEEALKRERYKHAAEMKALEEKLKESFIMEIQIEKQKNQELLLKYKNDSRLDENQVKSQLDALTATHKHELVELHKQIAENKARARETENRLRDEITSLKNIINKLQNKLGRLDTGAEAKVLELKTQLHSSRSELDERSHELKKCQDKLAQAKEENGFLEETVRNECEERFELTETLSQLKEELLAYRKPAGGYGPSTAWASVSSRAASATSSTKSDATKPQASRSEELSIYRKISSNHHPQPPSQPKQPLSEREVVNTNNAEVGLNSGKAKSPGRGLKGSSLTETRKRISSMLGRT